MSDSSPWTSLLFSHLLHFRISPSSFAGIVENFRDLSRLRGLVNLSATYRSIQIYILVPFHQRGLARQQNDIAPQSGLSGCGRLGSPQVWMLLRLAQYIIVNSNTFTCSSFKSLLSHMTSHVMIATSRYSTSMLDNGIVGCFLLPQAIMALPSINTNPNVDLRSSTFLAQSAFV